MKEVRKLLDLGGKAAIVTGGAKGIGYGIAYRLAEAGAKVLVADIDEAAARKTAEELTGKAKILKVFSTQQGRVVIGGRIEEGVLAERAEVKLMRQDEELGRGEIVSLQVGKKQTKKAEAGSEFGAMLKTNVEPAAGDYLEAFDVVLK